MADVAMWQDKQVQAEFEGQAGVVAIEPESGDFYVGATLGKADAAAYEHYPDVWVYFVRLDKPDAAIALPTW